MDNGQPVSLEEQDVPPDLAATVETAFGLDESPATLGDVVAIMTSFLEKSDRPVGVECLCTASESRHTARFDGETRHFHCVLDTLLLPFLHPEAAQVEVRSRSPRVDADATADATPDATADATPDATADATPDATADATPDAGANNDAADVVELTVSREDVSVRPPAAVMSFGLADGLDLSDPTDLDLSDPTDLDLSDPTDLDPTTAYTGVCPYVNAFPSGAMYEQWAEETPEATTLSVSFPTGLEIARALARHPQSADDR